MDQDFELLIVGGGPAGLSAALVAARARRRVLLVDGCTPRNSVAPAVHSFVTRDGVLPVEFRRAAREQLSAYPTVAFQDGEITAITGDCPDFTATFADGRAITARRVLLAIGLVDVLPDIAGLRERWGRGVHHCPYCDGYEHRDRAWGVIADEPTVFEYARFLRGWTGSVTLFTLGAEPQGEAVTRLQDDGVVVETCAIERVIGGAGEHLEGVVLEDGRQLPIESLWVRPAQRQRGLTARMGLQVTDDGDIGRDDHGETSIPGIFVAGDLAQGSTQQAVQAAADGARVAMTINHRLIVDDGVMQPR